MTDALGKAYPKLAARLQKQPIAELPTPLSEHSYKLENRHHSVLIKHDDVSSSVYGGNKIRKLEYLLQRAQDRNAKRIATFGAVGSNHALATAIHARRAGLECTCFLAHQTRTPAVPKTLDTHLRLGTEVVRWGGSVDRLAAYRRFIQGRKTWVIPLGGSCWLGAVGFVNAGLELAEQLQSTYLDMPQRIYIANGTMGSVAGLALGLALAQLPIDIHAVRVAPNRVSQMKNLERLKLKTLGLMRRLDPSIPEHVADTTRIVWRNEFFAGGYAASDATTKSAVKDANEEFGVQLDTTYTGKAMAALLSDLQEQQTDSRVLFWNTYNSVPLPLDGEALDRELLPRQFERYYEH